MNLRNSIDPAWLPTYEKEVRIIGLQLTELYGNIFILERIEAFPFNLLKIKSQPFWWAVRRALCFESIMIVWRIAVDTDGKTLTLRQLKN